MPGQWDAWKTILTIGVYVVAVGLIIILVGLAGRFTKLGHLPGDILVRKGNFTFYFPLATCLLISLALTLVSLFLRRK